MIVHILRNQKLPKYQNRGWTTFSTKNVIILETQNATYGCFSLPATHLIGQTFERCVAGTKAMRSAQSYPESPKERCTRGTAIGFELIKALFPRGSELEMHVLALELPQLSK